MDFNIGDKVKRINGTYGNMSEGQIGTIERFNNTRNHVGFKEFNGLHKITNIVLIEKGQLQDYEIY